MTSYRINGREVTPQEFQGGGGADRLAEMFASGKAPACNTDREFLHGHCNGNQFEKLPKLGDFYASVAKAHGQDVTGKVYLSGLADFPGDPEAFVSGKGDAQRVIEKRGWGCSGLVNVKPPELEKPDGKYRVADSLVAARAQELVAKGEAKAGEEASHVAREQLSPKGV